MNYYRLMGPIARMLPAEAAHEMAVKALSLGLIPPQKPFRDARLSQTICGLNFSNPVGMAAGFDKNAACYRALARQNFGFVEVGTVTPRPQQGNPKPRLFRLKDDGAVINRLGFNNHGAERMLGNLHGARDFLLGVNIGKNKDTEDAADDYVRLLEKFHGRADYITVNISSPNTSGLRDLQGKIALAKLLERILNSRTSLGAKLPIFVKLAPDLSDDELKDVAELAHEFSLDGLIMGNTTLSRPETLRSAERAETGGLSGAPLMALSTQKLRTLYQLTEGKIPLIGVGGIASGADAYAKIRAGASLVQLYSALVYHGFGLVTRILNDLTGYLERDGLPHISAAIGTDA